MQNIKHLYSRLVSANSTWSRSVKSSAKLAGLILRIIPLVYGTLSKSTIKVAWGFARNVVKMHQAQGPKGLAKYLKANYVLLQQSAGGYRIEAPWALGCNVARTRRGLPRIINPRQRALIISGHVPTIRFWLSLLGLYRVLDFKGSLKLSTITAPGKLIPRGFLLEWEEWVPKFLGIASIASRLDWEIVPSKDLTPYSIPVVRKSSPNSGGLASIAAIPLDLVRWVLDSNAYNALHRWLLEVDGLELSWGLRDLVIGIREDLKGRRYGRLRPGHWLKYQLAGIDCGSYLWSVWWPVTALGKLGFKMEPGKIRVFAMVDIITQAVMLPLHRALFKRLRGICTDGTFDQVAPVERLIKRMNETGKTFVASYDLSAATDRLPLVLQRMILDKVMGKKLSALWAELLVGRAYKLPRIAKSYNLGVSSVRYAVGQPMGAYSSWAMLAVTHHAIVQLAAKRVDPRCNQWFEWYAVLGDDIVIADEAVAREYLKIMELIGVEIGLAKSLVSHTTSLEFAKRTWINGTDCSPVSLDEALVALRHLGSLEELVRKQLKYGVLRLASVARFLGFGYRVLSQLQLGFVLGNRCGRMSAYLHRPGGVWAMPLKAWLTAVGPGGMAKGDTEFWSTALGLWSKILEALIRRTTRFEALLPFIELYSYSTPEARPLKKGEEQVPGEPEGKKLIRSYLADGKSLTKVVSQHAFNQFFTEWVTYPYAQSLRKCFDGINDKLRVLSPFILPRWEEIEEIWNAIMGYEAEAELLPTTCSFLRRVDEEEKVKTSRLIALWLTLRRIAKRSPNSLSLSTESKAWPKAERRWARGLGQDRLFMDTSIVWNEFSANTESQTKK